MSFVRDSKFRNIMVTSGKRETFYETIKVSDHMIETNGIAASSQFVAYMDGNGNSIGVIPLSNTGKSHPPARESVDFSLPQPFIRAHGQPTQDLQFNPFNPFQLASCSGDSTIKLWNIPSTEGLTEDMSNAALVMSNPDNKFPFREIAFHPNASGIMLARGTRNISLVDFSSGGRFISTTDKTLYSGDIQSACWSCYGDLIATTGKDKKVKLLDLRKPPSEVVVAEAGGHTGPRGSKVTWLGETSYFVSCGQNSMQEREMFVWDSRNMSKYVKRERFDVSTSLLIPLYEPDTRLLYVMSRGDASLRIFEIAKTGEEIYAITAQSTGDVVRGCCQIPKTACDLMGCEVGKILFSTPVNIQTVSVRVPRKEKLAFHDDLYPPTIWDVPSALPANQWLSGDNAALTRAPITPTSVARAVVAPVSAPAVIAPTISVPAAVTTTDIAPVISIATVSTPVLVVEDVSSPTLGSSQTSPSFRKSIKIPKPETTAIATTTATETEVIVSESEKEEPEILQPTITPSDVEAVSTNFASMSADAVDSPPEVVSPPVPTYTEPTLPTTPTPPAASGHNISLSRPISSTVKSVTDSSDLSQSTRSPSSNSRASTTFGSLLKYRHLYGGEAPKAQTYFNIRPSTLSDNALIACSDTYWAVPYQGSGGGPVYVSSFESIGKAPTEPPLINGHKSAVVDLTFSPFHNNILATAGGDCRVNIWKLPESPTDGLLEAQDESQALVRIPQLNANIKTIDYHPTISGLLAVTGQDLTVKLFDTDTGGGRLVTSVSLFGHGSNSETSSPNNLSFNYYGNLFAIASRDKFVRIYDARTKQCVGTTPEPGTHSTSLGKSLRVTWCASGNNTDGALITVSVAASGLRNVHAWDPRNLSEPVTVKAIDNGSGQLYPLYDESSGVCYIAAKGDTTIRNYELNFLTQSQSLSSSTQIDSSSSSSSVRSGFLFEKCNDFQTSREPIAGICLAPKRSCNVRNVEVSRVLKLTIDSVVPVSFHLSRAANIKDYFQDDVYAPIRSRQSMATIEQWECSSPDDVSFLTPFYESLQPSDMLKLSEKPAEEVKRPKTMDFRAAINQKELEDRLNKETFDRLSNMANVRASYHPNRSGGAGPVIKAKNDQAIVEGDEDEVDWDAED